MCVIWVSVRMHVFVPCFLKKITEFFFLFFYVMHDLFVLKASVMSRAK